jgi:hypothetical protein
MKLSRFILVWLLVAWMALAGMPAFAAGRVALIVANSTYEAAPLSNPATDAGLVAPVLERMGFEVTTVTDVDLASFDRTLREFEQKAEGADIAAFYFAGHGFAVNDGINVRNYLMSTSADVTSRSDRVIRAGGIPLDEIVASLSTSAKTSLIFVDACRNDPRVRSGAGGGRGLAPLPGGLGNAVFVGLSTRLGDTATDGEPGKGSPFARAFAAHMAEPGQRVIDAFTRVRLAVAEETGADQNPEIARQDLTAPVVLVERSKALEANSDPISNLEEGASAPDSFDTAVAAAEIPGPAVTVGSQSILLEEQAGGTGLATPFSGMVEWSRDFDRFGEAVIHGVVSIPARNLKLDLQIRKNSDEALPASHLIEVSFRVQKDFVGVGISSLPGVLLKGQELNQGMPLIGATARIEDNLFLFALSSGQSEEARNLELLGSQEWIDLPVIYSTGRRAIITIEKGEAGHLVFSSVLAAWGEGG